MDWQPTFDELGRSLKDVTFVVVDLETTGGSPLNGDAITEFGAVKVRGGEVISEFRTFVNPRSAIPAFITVLTGITDAMVINAPVIESVLPNFLAFCGASSECVLVAHNAPFDIGFLKSASSKLDYEWPNYSVIDTARIARLVLSKDEVPNCKLSTLAIYFNTKVQPTHRALDDAQTTVEVLHGLFERLGSQGVRTLEDLTEFTTRISPEQRSKKYLAEGIPATPGVYIFRDKKGEALYIGTSKNLRSRVRSYFSSTESRKRIKEMIVIADRIDLIHCATVIEAQVRELRLISEKRPRYNQRSMRQEKGIKQHHFKENYRLIADGMILKMNEYSKREEFEKATEVRNRLMEFVRGVYRGERITCLTSIPLLIAARRFSDDQWELVSIKYGRLAGSLISNPVNHIQISIDALKLSSEVVIAPTSSHEEVEKLANYLENDGIRLVEIDGTWALPSFGAGALQITLNLYRKGWRDFSALE